MNAGRTAILLAGDTLNFGGTEGQFVEVASGLDRSRWDVHVACLRADGPLRERLEAAGLRAWSCGRGSFKSPRFAAAVLGLAWQLRARRIRLVHSFDFYSNILGVLAGRLAGVPAVIASQRELGDLRPELHRRIHRAVLRLAHQVLVNSEAVAERVQFLRALDPERIVVIPNGVDPARFSPPPRPPRHVSGRVTIGTLAKLRPEKGVADLVRAAALVRTRYPGARFMICGEGPERPGLERLVQALGLEQTVDLRGSTAEPEAALRDLDVFVLPSLSEACSNALLEAMATGLAVIATRVGGNIDLVEDGHSGLLVPPGDPDALARAIIGLVRDPMLAERLGARGRDLARSRFGRDRMLSRIQELYEQRLAARVSPAAAQPV